MNYFNITNGFPNNDIRAVASDGGNIDGNNNIWIATWGGGLVKLWFVGVNWYILVFKNVPYNQNSLPNDYVTSITIDNLNGYLLIGTWGGGCSKLSYDQNSTTWICNNGIYSGISHPYVNSIFIDVSNNDKWVGSYDGGFAKIDSSGVNNIPTSFGSAPRNSINSIARASITDIWIGTFGNGLWKFDVSGFSLISNSNLHSTYITSILKDGINIWICFFGGGLVKYDGTNWTVYDTSNSGLPDNFVLSIAIGINNNIWIGTRYGGLAKFNLLSHNWTIYRNSYLSLPDNWVTSIAIQGTNVWLGTKNGGLVQI